MTMTVEDFQRLHELQTLDLGIDERRALLAKADDGSVARTELEIAQGELEELEEQLRQMRSKQRKLELDLEGVQDEKKEKTDRAYGGTISNPKELSALEQKIEELGRNAARHEDMIFEVMEQVEDLETQTNEQSEKVARLQTIYDATVQTYNETTAQARKEIAELEEAREQLVPELPEPLLTQYEQLRARHGGIAVAVLRGGTCAVCNVAVPRARWARIEEGASVFRCESCQRILVAAGKAV